jgi:hypothetical protein
LWRCNRGYGPCTTQNHLWTKFMSGTWNSSRVAACALRNEQAGRDCRACARNVCQEPSEVNTSREPGIADAGQKLGVSLPLLTCSPSAWSSRLLYRRGRKSRRDLRNTLYSGAAVKSTSSCPLLITREIKYLKYMDYKFIFCNYLPNYW